MIIRYLDPLGLASALPTLLDLSPELLLASPSWTLMNLPV